LSKAIEGDNILTEKIKEYKKKDENQKKKSNSDSKIIKKNNEFLRIIEIILEN
jgi:hypothetical protein